MLFTAAYTNLETIVPGIDTNPADINPGNPAPTAFEDSVWPGGTTLFLAGPSYSAGLSKRAVPLPVGVTQFTLLYQINPSQTAAQASQVHETDLMIVDAAANRYNGSCQKNNAIGGSWEIIDNDGAWTPIGFVSGLFAADVWTPVSVVYKVDFNAHTLKVLSISDGAQTFNIPTPQSISAIPNSGWQPSILDIQIQDCINGSGPASYTRSMRNIGIAMQ